MHAKTGLNADTKSKARKVGAFGVVGVTSTAIDFAVFAGLVAASFHPTVANVVAFFVANLAGYLLNARYTFRFEGRSNISVGGYGRYLSAYLLTLVISTGLIVLLASSIGPIGAKIIAVAITAVINYFLASRFVFQPSKKTPRSDGQGESD